MFSLKLMLQDNSHTIPFFNNTYLDKEIALSLKTLYESYKKQN